MGPMSTRDRRSSFALGLALLFGIVTLGACSSKDPAATAKEFAERAKSSIRSLDHAATSQKVEPDALKQIQQQLTAIQEYMGPINGKLDQVTLNAFEAFQRSEGMKADGMFTKSALTRLAEVAAQHGSAGKPDAASKQGGSAKPGSAS